MLAIDTRTPSAARGILLVLAAALVFACMDTTGKYLAAFYPVTLILAVRYAVNLLLVIGFFAPRQGFELFAVQRAGLVWLRSAALAMSSLCAVLALRVMPVAETLAIMYLAPFGVLLLSGPLLKEPVPFAGWVATGFGFLGLLLIVRPGSGLAPDGIAFALLTLTGTVVYHLLSRSLAKTETTMALLFYAALAGTAVFAVLLAWNWQPLAPTRFDCALLLGMGVMSMAGHFLFTAAYREAPVSLLTPVNYMHIAFAALFGWLVFSHIPDGLTALGIATVAAAGAGNALWTHFSKSRHNSSEETPDVPT